MHCLHYLQSHLYLIHIIPDNASIVEPSQISIADVKEAKASILNRNNNDPESVAGLIQIDQDYLYSNLYLLKLQLFLLFV